MTPEQITLVQSSFERLGPDLPTVTARFYQEVFRRHIVLPSAWTRPARLVTPSLA